ncbi:MAG TPA: DUF6614 family protein [Candidatus Didemnitutus sp.]|nr:DUF6614 family protein [Candidatus Didemnitutus sp.]
MLHYHVWFNLKPGVAEEAGLRVVREFLTELGRAGESKGFQLLRNFGRPPRSKLPVYHALIEFSDPAALDAAMKNQAQRGIHAGGHGRVIDVVCDFHVEIFTSIATPGASGTPRASEA